MCALRARRDFSREYCDGVRPFALEGRRWSAYPRTTRVDDYERLRHVADKWLLYELCARLDIPTPRTVLAGEGGIDSEGIGFPCLVKPRLGKGTRGVRIVQTAEDLARVLSDPPLFGASPDEDHPYIVQELIEGSIANVGSFAVRGRPVSLMTQRRTFTRFEFGGTAIVNRTTHERVIMEYAERLLGELAWSGPALFEFISAPDGRYYLIDGNPRVWASTDLTVASGLNVCQQAVDIFVRDVEPETIPEYTVGLTMRWLSPPAIGRCFRRPRRPSAVWRRLSTLLSPRRPSTTITNLRRGNFRHLLGKAADSSRT